MSVVKDMKREAAHRSKRQGTNTLVSIIMPIYNRERFLAQAIASIRNQTYVDWELIVVDDGSIDNSIRLLETLCAELEQRVLIVQQENQGPAVARNKGFEHANGALLAFFDSDDVWLEHHLHDCVSALLNNEDIDWVYSACERVNYESGERLLASTFYEGDKENALFSAVKESRGLVKVLDSERAMLIQLSLGLDNGLQNSVLRRSIFEKHALPPFRVGEDRLFILMALKSQFTIAFIDNIHVRYHVHNDNISDTNKSESDYSKRIEALERLIAAKAQIPIIVSLNQQELDIHKEQLAREVFWELGYSLYQASGDFDSAIACYWKAIKLRPSHWKFYKTLLLAYLKRWLH